MFNLLSGASCSSDGFRSVQGLTNSEMRRIWKMAVLPSLVFIISLQRSTRATQLSVTADDLIAEI
jgi:hypothetical protein